MTLSFYVALTFVVLGIAGLRTALRLPFSTPITAIGGPGTFPAAFLVIIITFSAILAATELVKSFSVSESSEIKSPAKIGKKAATRILLLIACVTIYILTLSKAGFMISTSLLTLALLWLFDYRNKILSPVLAIGFTILLRLLFQTFLKVLLP